MLAADNHTACGLVADLDQIDTRGGHGNGLFDVGTGALGNQTAYEVVDTDGLLCGTTDDDVVVRAEDGDVGGVHVVNANGLLEDGGDFGCRLGEHKDDVGIGAEHVAVFGPADEAESIVSNGLKCDIIANEAEVDVGLNIVDEDMTSVGVEVDSERGAGSKTA